MSSTLDQFLFTIKRTRDADTSLFYKSHLVPLQHWLSEQGKSLDNCTAEDVYSYLEQVRVGVSRDKRKWKMSSKNALLTALKRWARWQKQRIPIGASTEELRHTMEEERRLDRLAGMERFKVKREMWEPVSKEDFVRLLGVLPVEPRRVAFLIGYFGFRLGELKKIKRINYKEGWLVVETEKTGIDRKLWFNGTCARTLGGVQKDGLLDRSKDWLRFHLARDSRKVLKRNVKPHDLRRMFNTEMWRKTRDPILVKRLLGHSASDMTMLYTGYGEEVLRRTMTTEHYLADIDPKLLEV